MSFKAGDLVKLKSGSPVFTVAFIRDDNVVVMAWYDTNSQSIKTEKVIATILELA